MKRLFISVDGASRGNPGPAGIGVVISDESGKLLKEVSEPIGEATNNFAEYTALIRGLSEVLKLGASNVIVQTDSELLARQINGVYKVRNQGIVPLYAEADKLLEKFVSASVKHVTRENNKAADKLASAAAGKAAPRGDKNSVGSKASSKIRSDGLLLSKERAMIHKISVRTSMVAQFVDITNQVRDAVKSSGVTDGICNIFVPHTTAGITINENADPDVTADILEVLSRLVPRAGHYRHMEGNADSHVKASMMGSSVTVFVEDGRLVLGTWQGIYFCEFDGPRARQVFVKIT